MYDGRTVLVTDEAAAELPPAPEVAREVFGERYADAVRYAELLADAGVRRGLIGPREVPRLWERHLLNCAVLSEVIPHGVSVCDVGSGAGLPGIPLALTRPDLSITLLEPLLRRTTFLEEVVRLLGLGNVTVVRGRAEEMIGKLPAVDVVTARAVAPLDRLAGWGLPLLRPHGEMAVLKGDTAEEELKAARAALEAGSVRWRPPWSRSARGLWTRRRRWCGCWRARALAVCGRRPAGRRRRGRADGVSAETFALRRTSPLGRTAPTNGQNDIIRSVA